MQKSKQKLNYLKYKKIVAKLQHQQRWRRGKELGEEEKI